MNRGSLRLRLLLAGAVSVLLALALSALGLTLLFERHVERRVQAELAVYLDQIVVGLDRGADGALTASRTPADPRFAEPLSGLYWQVEAADVVLRSRSLWDVVLALPADELADGAVHQHRLAGPGGSLLIALERSVTLPARLGGGITRIVVGIDAADSAAATRAFALDLLPYLAVIAAFLIAAAYAQVAVGLRPLAAVRRRIAAIRQGKAQRLGEAFPDEILPLAAEVDELLEAREKQIATARARAGDLAHGFKTPLQVLLGDVERLRAKGEDAVARQIEEVASTMQRHVDRELARTRMATGNLEARARISEVIERVVAVVARTPAGARLEWSVKGAEKAVGRIDPDDHAEAIGNLVENAARHARAKVSICTRRKARFITVTIADDGPGIPQERLDEVRSRGGRVDRSGSGAGLGLAIVDDIAEACGGYLHLRTGTTGFEAEFAVAPG